MAGPAGALGSAVAAAFTELCCVWSALWFPLLLGGCECSPSEAPRITAGDKVYYLERQEILSVAKEKKRCL